MKKYKYPLFISFIVFIQSCQSNGNDSSNEEVKVVEYDDDSIRCPKGKHTDSIIEIVYGLPSEELFQQADSGLVMLGGCEESDDAPYYYCKRHTISF